MIELTELTKVYESGPRTGWPASSAAARWGRVIVGSPATVGDELERRVEEADITGFSLGDYDEGTTLRERLFGAGPRLPESHPGARYRNLAAAAV